MGNLELSLDSAQSDWEQATPRDSSSVLHRCSPLTGNTTPVTEANSLGKRQADKAQFNAENAQLEIQSFKSSQCSIKIPTLYIYIFIYIMTNVFIYIHQD
jgi:hypothetical protein